MAKSRSPNYPSMSLPDAIDKARDVYRADYLNEMPVEVVVQHMGYSSLNGASLSAMSALKKYGLLEGRGDTTHVSKEAQLILEEMPGADDAIREMAFRPSLWAEIRENYSGKKPSTANLRAFLLGRGFNPKKVDLVAKLYFATMDFVEDLEAEGSPNAVPAAEPDAGPAQRGEGGAPSSPPSAPIAAIGESGQTMTIPMGRDFVVSIGFSGEITQKRLRKLVSFVELAMDDYPEDVPNRDQGDESLQPTD